MNRPGLTSRTMSFVSSSSPTPSSASCQYPRITIGPRMHKRPASPGRASPCEVSASPPDAAAATRRTAPWTAQNTLRASAPSALLSPHSPPLVACRHSQYSVEMRRSVTHLPDFPAEAQRARVPGIRASPQERSQVKLGQSSGSSKAKNDGTLPRTSTPCWRTARVTALVVSGGAPINAKTTQPRRARAMLICPMQLAPQYTGVCCSTFLNPPLCPGAGASSP
mmetsp:Transcript_59047/g.106089  ORF Transcript_59047/g.106089 Transcript_59047/m.106089 type:complete len:223 (-) Transcript_59047:557-1225(-)